MGYPGIGGQQTSLCIGNGGLGKVLYKGRTRSKSHFPDPPWKLGEEGSKGVIIPEAGRPPQGGFEML